jgi:tetratricopeptide (TPR) repeat protein
VGLLRSAAAAFVLVVVMAAEAKDDPKKAFERGRELYFKGDYAAALPHLKQAYELSNKRPSTIRALAHCERALGMNADALGHLREYLATRPSDAAEIEAQIAELEAPPQTLEPVDVREPREEEDFVWDATRPDPPPSRAELVAPATPPVVEPDLIERPVFWVVIAGVVAAGTAVALSVALSGSEELFGGSEDQVLRR